MKNEELKTAKQHNAPQTGESEFTPSRAPVTAPIAPKPAPQITTTTAPLPARAVAAVGGNPTPVQKPPAREAAQTSAGWSLRGISGPREEVIEKIQSAQAVPEKWKLAIIESVNSHPDWRWVTLHVHAQALRNKEVINYDLTGQV